MHHAIQPACTIPTHTRTHTLQQSRLIDGSYLSCRLFLDTFVHISTILLPVATFLTFSQLLLDRSVCERPALQFALVRTVTGVVGLVCPLPARLLSPRILLLSARRITCSHPPFASLLTSVALLDILYVIRRVEQHLHVLHESADLVHCGTFGVENVVERVIGHLSEILRVHGGVRLRQQLLGFHLAELLHVFHHFPRLCVCVWRLEGRGRCGCVLSVCVCVPA